MTVGGKHAVFALTPNVQSRVCPSPSVSPDTYHHSLITNKPLPTMVAINGREVIGRAVGIFHTYYNLFFSKLSFTRLPGSLGGSASSVRRRASIRVTPNDPVSKGRKKGRGKPKRSNNLARDNSSVFLPGGFRREHLNGGASRKRADRNLEGDIESIYCDLESTDGG